MSDGQTAFDGHFPTLTDDEEFVTVEEQLAKLREAIAETSTAITTTLPDPKEGAYRVGEIRKRLDAMISLAKVSETGQGKDAGGALGKSVRFGNRLEQRLSTMKSAVAKLDIDPVPSKFSPGALRSDRAVGNSGQSPSASQVPDWMNAESFMKPSSSPRSSVHRPAAVESINLQEALQRPPLSPRIGTSYPPLFSATTTTSTQPQVSTGGRDAGLLSFEDLLGKTRTFPSPTSATGSPKSGPVTPTMLKQITKRTMPDWAMNPRRQDATSLITNLRIPEVSGSDTKPSPLSRERGATGNEAPKVDGQGPIISKANEVTVLAVEDEEDDDDDVGGDKPLSHSQRALLMKTLKSPTSSPNRGDGSGNEDSGGVIVPDLSVYHNRQSSSVSLPPSTHLLRTFGITTPLPHSGNSSSNGSTPTNKSINIEVTSPVVRSPVQQPQYTVSLQPPVTSPNSSGIVFDRQPSYLTTTAPQPQSLVHPLPQQAQLTRSRSPGKASPYVPSSSSPPRQRSREPSRDREYEAGDDGGDADGDVEFESERPVSRSQPRKQQQQHGKRGTISSSLGGTGGGEDTAYVSSDDRSEDSDDGEEQGIPLELSAPKFEDMENEFKNMLEAKWREMTQDDDD